MLVSYFAVLVGVRTKASFFPCIFSFSHTAAAIELLTGASIELGVGVF